MLDDYANLYAATQRLQRAWNARHDRRPEAQETLKAARTKLESMQGRLFARPVQVAITKRRGILHPRRADGPPRRERFLISTPNGTPCGELLLQSAWQGSNAYMVQLRGVVAGTPCKGRTSLKQRSWASLVGKTLWVSALREVAPRSIDTQAKAGAHESIARLRELLSNHA